MGAMGAMGMSALVPISLAKGPTLLTPKRIEELGDKLLPAKNRQRQSDDDEKYDILRAELVKHKITTVEHLEKIIMEHLPYALKDERKITGNKRKWRLYPDGVFFTHIGLIRTSFYHQQRVRHDSDTFCVWNTVLA